MQKLTLPNDHYISFQRSESRKSAHGVTFCSGYGSDMTGTKAQALLKWGQKTDRAVTLFDYQGCGASSGDFKQATIGLWASNTETILEKVTAGPQILIGSSMGGWMAMLMAKLMACKMTPKIKHIILIAPAPDFPEKLILPSLSPEKKALLAKNGFFEEETGLIFTEKLIKEAPQHHILGGKAIPFEGSVRVLHGEEDSIVPWRYGLEALRQINSPDASFTLVRGGEHSLSRPQDITLLCQTIENLPG